MRSGAVRRAGPSSRGCGWPAGPGTAAGGRCRARQRAGAGGRGRCRGGVCPGHQPSQAPQNRPAGPCDRSLCHRCRRNCPVHHCDAFPASQDDARPVRRTHCAPHGPGSDRHNSPVAAAGEPGSPSGNPDRSPDDSGHEPECSTPPARPVISRRGAGLGGSPPVAPRSASRHYRRPLPARQPDPSCWR